MTDHEHEAGPGTDAGSTGTATLTAPAKTEPKRKTGELPPYKVLLHNDDVNTFEHVIAAVVRLTGMAVEEALLKALEAHETGVALLLVTHLERAELLVEQFMSLSVTTTLEPA
ncbi:MAG TPA: ATP-dependent Clp protease adaptor ClpS [Phycisphaerae bacterium]|nr:ATP-dependent Clp protease adaptor ClpS [Phycisphaerae bacterium]HNU44538.1 ATP-dependent Clp protease adaptor ClpS [Phycisphaerae bacterium]